MPVDARARFFTNKQGFGQAGLSAGAVFRLSPMITVVAACNPSGSFRDRIPQRQRS